MKKNIPFQKIFCFISACFIAMVLHCRVSVIDISSLTPANNPFISYHLTDLFVLSAVYLMIRHVTGRDGRPDLPTALCAVLFSLIYLVALSFQRDNSLLFMTGSYFQMLFSGMCVIGLSLLFYFLLRLLFLHADTFAETCAGSPQGDAAPRSGRRFLLCSFLIIFLCWLPWIFVNFPGSFCPDSISQLKQYLGYDAFTSHHPPLSTFLMGGLTEAGAFFVDRNFGCFLYLLLQSFLGALIFSYSIRLLYELGIPLKYCLAGILFFALVPLWGAFAQWYEKDLLYAEATVLFALLLSGIVLTRQCGTKKILLLIPAGILLSLLRKEGIFSVVISMAALALYLKKGARKRLLIALSLVAFLYVCTVKILYPSMGIRNGSLREALSIPFQQTARYVTAYGSEVTDREKSAIDAVLDYDALKNYDPDNSDPVKNTWRDNDSALPEYLAVWFQMFLKHPDVYLAAFFNNSYGYLAPVAATADADISLEYPSSLSELGIYRTAGNALPTLFRYLLAGGTILPLIRYLYMPGTYTWIAAVCIILLIRRKKYPGLILFLPAVTNILLCLASPLSRAIRYELPTAALTPFLIGWTFSLIRFSDQDFRDLLPAHSAGNPESAVLEDSLVPPAT